MIRVFYEEYYNDFIRKNREKAFANLTELEEWIFGQMEQDYTKPFVMFFPAPEIMKRIHADGPGRIEFTPKHSGSHIWIHQIKNCNGIIFSDGSFTAERKHWSKEMQEWLKHCDERQHSPEFEFVE